MERHHEQMDKKLIQSVLKVHHFIHQTLRRGDISALAFLIQFNFNLNIFSLLMLLGLYRLAMVVAYGSVKAA